MTKPKQLKIPQDKWKWYGMPLHLCVANDCIFHLGTMVGSYVISTIGYYIPGYKRVNDAAYVEKNVEDIGCDRKYETMVFEMDGIHKCGCPDINPNEIDSSGYNDHIAADKGHMKMCLKYANKKV